MSSRKECTVLQSALLFLLLAAGAAIAAAIAAACYCCFGGDVWHGGSITLPYFSARSTAGVISPTNDPRMDQRRSTQDKPMSTGKVMSCYSHRTNIKKKNITRYESAVQEDTHQPLRPLTPCCAGCCDSWAMSCVNTALWLFRLMKKASFEQYSYCLVL